MTEIQVLIPLSVFGDAKDLTPQGISEAIVNVSSLKEQIVRLQAEKDTLVRTINNIGVSLESIWLDSKNELERARNIRSLIKDLKSFGDENK